MKALLNPLKRLAIFLATAFSTAAAWAYPMLQLDIKGGTYDNTTQTIVATSNTFSVYAYGLAGQNGISLADNFYLSMALVPPSSIAGDYGSFTFNGSTIQVTSDMVLGTPPIETTLEAQGSDAGDLSRHGIFPTYFIQRQFQFSGANTSAAYDTSVQTGSGPQAGTGMYFARFDINVGGLNPGLGIHFDLYNEKMLANGDIDVNFFAPCSHDAEGFVQAVPEPASFALLGIGLLGLGIGRRRKRAAT